MPDMPGYFLLFGCGTLTVVKRTEALFDEEKGILIKRIWLRMDADYERKNNIKDGDKDPTGLIMKEYNADYFYPLDDNPETQTWIAICDFKGTLSNKMVDLVNAANLKLTVALRKQVHQLQLRIATLQAEKTRLSNDNMAEVEQLVKITSKLQGTERGGDTGGE